VAANTILYVANAFLGVFGADLLKLVFVAAEAGISFEIPTLVASGASCIMRTGQSEKAVMVESRRLPAGLATVWYFGVNGRDAHFYPLAREEFPFRSQKIPVCRKREFG
jgi:hypothetical protein